MKLNAVDILQFKAIARYLATCRPVPKITWKKQNKGGNWQNLVHGKDSFEIATAFQGRRLKIISVKEDMHETKYRCEAENSQSAGTPLVHDIQLNVEGKWP